ncbi:bifunctional 2-polyprenyl-6-hydroxyphenol methylase/3-demethylubiquinol 3-O-methyltransferase UbiG [Flavobacterium sp.]|uniref:class I SAM-dependent methyltransferase n=1 Tax=Flavobacterium sp. TaxID=239 RepID=UPI0025CECF2D|nr:class I SAM-dependent methyltransferase [Flavobacterium sp.]
MINFWDERYAAEAYAYGTAPNVFFKETIGEIPKGKLLFPAEGEGRNAVFAAQLGYEVYAFDTSKEAKNKADKLAQKYGVTLDYSVGDLETLNYPESYFDALILIYAHVPAEIRTAFCQHLLRLLKPNGQIIFESFSQEQLNYTSGGPKNSEMLFSEAQVKNDFPNVDFDFLTTEVISLDEGKYHQGLGSVVRFRARKLS